MKLNCLLAMSVISMSVILSGCGDGKDATNTTEVTSVDSKDAATEAATVDNSAINAKMADIAKGLIGNSDKLCQLEEKTEGEVIATMKTSMGNIVFRLFPDKAPKAVENFVTHAKKGYYNGLSFHRIIKDFMIQGGDPAGNGTGGESIWGKGFENEMSSDMRSFNGALCMANSGLDTNGSQFYIVQNNNISAEEKQMLEALKGMQEQELTRDVVEQNQLLFNFAKTVVTKTGGKVGDDFGVKVKDVFSEKVIDAYLNNGGTPFLDYGYTIFGQVKSGLDVVEKIAAVEVTSSASGENSTPVQKVTVDSIVIE